MRRLVTGALLVIILLGAGLPFLLSRDTVSASVSTGQKDWPITGTATVQF